MIEIIERDGKWGVVADGEVTWLGYPWAAKAFSLYLRTKQAEALAQTDAEEPLAA